MIERPNNSLVTADKQRAPFPASFAPAAQQLRAAQLLRRCLQLNSGSVGRHGYVLFEPLKMDAIYGAAVLAYPLMCTAIGGFVVKSGSVPYRRSLLATALVMLFASLLLILLPVAASPLERVAMAIGLFVPAFCTLMVTLRPQAWRQPAWLLLKVPLAYFGSFLVVANVGMALGLPK